MLVLTRKTEQSIMIGDDIEIHVLSIRGGKVRLGIDAPSDVPVFRNEIYEQRERDRDADPSRRCTFSPDDHDTAGERLAAVDDRSGRT